MRIEFQCNGCGNVETAKVGDEHSAKSGALSTLAECKECGEMRPWTETKESIENRLEEWVEIEVE